MGIARTKKRGATKGSAVNAKELEEKLRSSEGSLRKEFEKVRAAIAKLRGEGSEAFDELYELVGRVLGSDPPLYLGGGYRTTQDFIAAELPGETLRSVQRNVLVARCFSPADEAQHGINFLEEVASYAKEISGAEEPPAAINLDRLMITLPSSRGASVAKRARDATIDDVRKARRALRGGPSKSKRSPAEAAIRSALAKDKTLATIGVRIGAGAASFSSVPLASLSTFASALTHVSLPKSPPPAKNATKKHGTAKAAAPKKSAPPAKDAPTPSAKKATPKKSATAKKEAPRKKARSPKP